MQQSIVVTPFRTFLGTLLVGGTALGAGILALPVVTANSGLIPAWVIYLLCWLFSAATGLLFVEIGLWLPKNANIVSMAVRLLGPLGKIAAWILYIFFFYCLTIAYISGGGSLVGELIGKKDLFWLGTTLFTLFFAIFVYLGTKVASRLNGVLMVGLVVTYLAFVVIGFNHVHIHSWEQFGWKGALFAVPVIFGAFSYQGVIPSLLDYLGRDPKKTKIAILSGTAIPFVAYMVWDFIIKGIVPTEGPHGLMATKLAGVSAVEPLGHILGHSHIYVWGNFFAFFALTTSFIGVTLGLLDFLADSLNVEKTKGNRFWLCVLIYLPPLLITLMNPRVFLQALGFAGGFGAALLLGLLPILMVWVGRYRKGYSEIYQQLPGGKPVLVLLTLFVLLEVVIEILVEMGF